MTELFYCLSHKKKHFSISIISLYMKRNRKVPPYFPIQNSLKIDLNQFINLTHRKDIIKILWSGIFTKKIL